MKVIDLLNKIANGEDIPRVKYDDIEAYIGADGYLKDNYGDNVEWWIDKNWLNTEVEIIEKKKIPEKLIPTSLKGIDNLDEKIEIAHIDTISAIETINEIIDYLESKGE